MKQFYVRHVSFDPEDGVAYFGPFSEDELDERFNDAYADGLVHFGPIEEVDELPRGVYVNPRSYWMDQLEKFEELNR